MHQIQGTLSQSSLSTKSFKKLNIVELFALMRKVIKGGARINELMRSFIEEKIKDIGVEAFQEPAVVKYYKPSDTAQHDSL